MRRENNFTVCWRLFKCSYTECPNNMGTHCNSILQSLKPHISKSKTCFENLVPWSFLTSQVVRAVRGQKYHISAPTLALNLRFIPQRQVCLPKIQQEIRSDMTLSLHSALRRIIAVVGVFLFQWVPYWFSTLNRHTYMNILNS